MSTAQIAWNTSNQAITSALGGLANAAAKTITVIDLSAATLLDILIQVTAVKTNASGTSATGYVAVYVAATADGGTTYTEGATSNASITMVSPTNLVLLDKINCVANATTYKGGPKSVAALFGGALPDHIIVVIQNQTGAALDATNGNHAVIYQQVKGTIA